MRLVHLTWGPTFPAEAPSDRRTQWLSRRVRRGWGTKLCKLQPSCQGGRRCSRTKPFPLLITRVMRDHEDIVCR